MTRQEEIRNAIDTIIPIIPNRNGRTYEQALMASGFEEGIKWAEENPKLHWISIEESLPKQDEEVIVLCDELNTAPYYKISFGHIVDKTICNAYNGWNIPAVVYWFPMAKLPKE